MRYELELSLLCYEYVKRNNAWERVFTYVDVSNSDTTRIYVYNKDGYVRDLK